ncbi:Protein of unknown function [Pyronema omphalodes CBS 100304]|uniref:Uncharacterized protein n=1 Tax=Pyronema omphalodes (strain CBS 100304) TaxID=1076935 RepID=U4LIQ8_PYROM|nr:Protein of unknown function [Pyronema omphalodes CBS 100304]
MLNLLERDGGPTN